MTQPSPIPWHQKAYVCVHIFEDTRPVLLVSRNGGAWSLLCGHGHDDIMLGAKVVGIGHILDRDPTILPLLDLPAGWEAERETPTGDWVRRPPPESESLPPEAVAVNESVKIRFTLEKDEDGYPPFTSERLWARKLGEDLYEIDNIPFFVRDLSLGDRVSAEAAEAGVFVFRGMGERSSNSTIRVFVIREEVRTALFGEIEKSGAEYELGAVPDMVAINIPVNSDVAGLLRYLDEASREKALDYEEAAPRYALNDKEK